VRKIIPIRIRLDTIPQRDRLTDRQTDRLQREFLYYIALMHCQYADARTITTVI